MKLEMDKIVFEYRIEVINIRKALLQYAKEHPTADNVEDVKLLADKLEVMDMTW